jgi:hypothetical protein
MLRPSNGRIPNGKTMAGIREACATNLLREEQGEFAVLRLHWRCAASDAGRALLCAHTPFQWSMARPSSITVSG